MRDRRGWVDHESMNWVEAGIITSEQRSAIVARYPEGEERKRQASLFAVLGSLLVGVGTILFVATNWEEIPRWVRLVMLTAATLAAHGTGWYLRERTGRSPKVGHALYFLGSLIFGGTLFLVAQMYNVNANAPWLLLVWLIGVAPMAWGLASRPMLGLSVLLGALWLGFQGAEWMQLARNVNTPAAIMMPFLGFGVFLWGLGRAHLAWARLRSMEDFDPVLRAFGLVSMMAGVYVLTFDFRNDFGGDEVQRAMVPQLFGILLGTLAVGLAGLAWWLGSRRKRLTIDVVEVSAIAGLGLLGLATYLAPDALVNAALYNLVLFAAIVGTILLGFQHGDELLINLGVLFFVVDVVTRYFDFFYDLLDRSLFFIVGGLLLIGGGWLLERQRKTLVARAREGVA